VSAACQQRGSPGRRGVSSVSSVSSMVSSSSEEHGNPGRGSPSPGGGSPTPISAIFGLASPLVNTFTTMVCSKLEVEYALTTFGADRIWQVVFQSTSNCAFGARRCNMTFTTMVCSDLQCPMRKSMPFELFELRTPICPNATICDRLSDFGCLQSCQRLHLLLQWYAANWGSDATHGW